MSELKGSITTKKKVFVVIGLITLHALATACVALTIFGWTFANGESLHPQPKPLFIKDLEAFVSFLAFPVLEFLFQGLHYIGGRFHIRPPLDLLSLCTIVVMNSASLILPGLGLWLVVRRYLRRSVKDSAG